MLVDCDTFSTREQILDAILEQRGIFINSKTILRIQLVGALDPRLDLSLTELEERLAGEVLYIRWDDQTHPALDFESICSGKDIAGAIRAHPERTHCRGRGE